MSTPLLDFVYFQLIFKSKRNSIWSIVSLTKPSFFNLFSNWQNRSKLIHEDASDNSLSNSHRLIIQNTIKPSMTNSKPSEVTSDPHESCDMTHTGWILFFLIWLSRNCQIINFHWAIRNLIMLNHC